MLAATIVQAVCSVLNDNPPSVADCMVEWGLTEEERRERDKRKVGGFVGGQVKARQ